MEEFFFFFVFLGHITDISKLRHYFYIKTKVGISWRKIHTSHENALQAGVGWFGVISADGGAECGGGAPEFPLPFEVLQWRIFQTWYVV